MRFESVLVYQSAVGLADSVVQIWQDDVVRPSSLLKGAKQSDYLITDVLPADPNITFLLWPEGPHSATRCHEKG